MELVCFSFEHGVLVIVHRTSHALASSRRGLLNFKVTEVAWELVGSWARSIISADHMGDVFCVCISKGRCSVILEVT